MPPEQILCPHCNQIFEKFKVTDEQLGESAEAGLFVVVSRINGKWVNRKEGPWVYETTGYLDSRLMGWFKEHLEIICPRCGLTFKYDENAS